MKYFLVKDRDRQVPSENEAAGIKSSMGVNQIKKSDTNACHATLPLCGIPSAEGKACVLSGVIKSCRRGKCAWCVQSKPAVTVQGKTTGQIYVWRWR